MQSKKPPFQADEVAEAAEAATSSTAAPATSDAAAPCAPATNTNQEVAAALLNVLRSLDRQATATTTAVPDLSQEALAAVARFRDISAALAVESFNFGNGSGFGNRAGRA